MGLRLAAIGREPPGITAPFAARKGIEYPVLSDVGSKVIREYGLLNTTLDPEHEWYGVPFPGTFVLDRERRVTARFFEPSYRIRMTGESLNLRLGGPPHPKKGTVVRASNEQLDVTIFSSDAEVAPGQLLTVIIEVRAKPGVHVYAPGDHPYRAIRLKLAPDSQFSERDAIHPESETFHFEPLDEHVPVFQGTFRILKPVVLEPSRELAALAREPDSGVTLRATLELQACDHEICFVPESIPVELPLVLRAFESK